MSHITKTIAITGASSGIGEATARLLASRGHRVVLGARRVDRIAALADEIRTGGGEALHHSLDVTSLDAMRAFVTAGSEHFGPIEVLINNAGVMPLSPMSALRIDEWNQTIDINIRGVLHGIAAVLSTMLERGAGHIVNIASTAGLQAAPTASVYCASKFAVRAISESLRQEHETLRVTIISPGLTRSELIDGIADQQVHAAIRAMADRTSIQPDAIAQAISYAIDQPPDVDVNEIVVRPTAQR